ncbi:MAG: hypothetical protein M1825_004688 [Sarcosagium campestre]|nr:MAG: hypothetical protein M1825_004688 [Sarcosagium campestre]
MSSHPGMQPTGVRVQDGHVDVPSTPVARRTLTRWKSTHTELDECGNPVLRSIEDKEGHESESDEDSPTSRRDRECTPPIPTPSLITPVGNRILNILSRITDSPTPTAPRDAAPPTIQPSLEEMISAASASNLGGPLPEIYPIASMDSGDDDNAEIRPRAFAPHRFTNRELIRRDSRRYMDIHNGDRSIHMTDNVPNRFELFLLGEGEKKVQIEPDTRIPSSTIFIFNKEDHTLGNLLRARLLQSPIVKFAGYRVPHPLVPKFELRVQTDGSITPKEALVAACRDVVSDLGILGREFTKEVELKKMTGAMKDPVAQ